MNKEEDITKYKLNKIARESLRNSIRLHLDSLDSRVSTPSKIKQKDARHFISIINDELLRICSRIEEDEFYFEGGKGMDKVFDYEIYKSF